MSRPQRLLLMGTGLDSLLQRTNSTLTVSYRFTISYEISNQSLAFFTVKLYVYFYGTVKFLVLFSNLIVALYVKCLDSVLLWQ